MIRNATAIKSSAAAAEIYSRGRARKALLILALLTLIAVAFVYACTVGAASISHGDVITAIMHRVLPDLVGAPDNPLANSIVVNMRIPRILLALLTGMSLALAGTVMQGVLRNSLVSPFTLGLSSAASFGAAVSIVLGPGTLGFLAFALGGNENYYIAAGSFMFGCLSMVLVYLISRVKNAGQVTLILSGVVIGYIFQAGVYMLKYVSDNDRLRDLVMWLMGGMWGAKWDVVILLIPIVLISFVLLAIRSWDLNALSAGDDIAKNLGVNVDGLRIYCLAIATLVASSCLAFTGVIGFIGLMAPHICRMIIGNDYRFLIPCACLTGGLILLVSDTFARTILIPQEIPVGIIMYVIGGAFFIFLLVKGRESHIY